MAEPRIDRIESAPLIGRRPRAAGNNARLNMHGIEVELRVLRLTTSDGASGFGLCFASAEEAERLLGVPVSNLLPDDGSVPADWRAFDFPIWDLGGRAARQARIYAGRAGRRHPRSNAACTVLRYVSIHERPALGQRRSGRGANRRARPRRLRQRPSRLQDQGRARRPPHAPGSRHQTRYRRHQGRARGGRPRSPNHDRRQQRLHPQYRQARPGGNRRLQSLLVGRSFS